MNLRCSEEDREQSEPRGAGVAGRGWTQPFFRHCIAVSSALSLCAEEQNQGRLSAAFHLAINEQIGPANVYRHCQLGGGGKEEKGGGSMKGEMTHFTSLSHSTVNVFHSRYGSHRSSLPNFTFFPQTIPTVSL